MHQVGIAGSLVFPRLRGCLGSSPRAGVVGMAALVAALTLCLGRAVNHPSRSFTVPGKRETCDGLLTAPLPSLHLVPGVPLPPWTGDLQHQHIQH